MTRIYSKGLKTKTSPEFNIGHSGVMSRSKNNHEVRLTFSNGVGTERVEFYIPLEKAEQLITRLTDAVNRAKELNSKENS